MLEQLVADLRAGKIVEVSDLSILLGAVVMMGDEVQRVYVFRPNWGGSGDALFELAAFLDNISAVGDLILCPGAANAEYAQEQIAKGNL